MQLRPLDHVGVEDREDAQHVEGVEDGNAIEQDQVLVRRAAAHVEGGPDLRYPRHARNRIDGTDRIGLDRACHGPHTCPVHLHGHARRGLLEAHPVAFAETVHLDPLERNRALGQGDTDLDNAPRRDRHRLIVARVADAAHREHVVSGSQAVEGEVAETVGQGHPRPGGIARRAQDGGGVLDGKCDLGAYPAPDRPVKARYLRRCKGDDDHLRPEFDISELGAVQQLVEGAGDVQRVAGAGDVVAGGEKAGAEGDLDAGALGKPGKRIGQGQLLDREAGGGGEKGAGLGFDAGPALEQRDLLGVLGAEWSREEGGDEHEDRPASPE